MTSGSLCEDDMDIVIETRDRQNSAGRKRINDSMERSINERSATCGIYVSKDQEGLGKEIGDWAEGQSSLGPWVATTDEHLITAIRVLIMNQRWARIRNTRAEVDIEEIEPQIERVRTSLKRVANISKKTTAIRQGADYIQEEGELLRNEIRGALTEIEESLRKVELGTDS